ncbi:MAG: S26 family signal peptidase [Bacteroidetes bacterium]|jgi:signal peptidase I|nr:S26 family signal peptidase [Bacteroidota bacterium]
MKFNPSRKDLLRFVVVTVIYILWVIWLNNYWFLLGLPIIFDIYISKKVNWTPWKKREGKNSAFIEWFDALIFAVVAVTIINIFLFQNYRIPTGSMEKTLLVGDHLFVSKMAYGPKIPNTPLTLPFTQNVLPLSGGKRESYLKWIQWEHKRLAGFREVKRDDIVVFNFPEGDTVIVGMSNKSYYGVVKEEAAHFKSIDRKNGNPIKTDKFYENKARKFITETQDIVVRPVDRKDNYIKRCVAVAGDTLEIVNGQLVINGSLYPEIEHKQYIYLVKTNGTRINSRILEELDIYPDDRTYNGRGSYLMPLTDNMKDELEKLPNVISIEPQYMPDGHYHSQVFPRDPRYPWNRDNFGPLYMPEQGRTISLTMDNLPLYERIIDHYEDNDLEIKDSIIYINGQAADKYTFQMDYYWMMGDNRHQSLDSRFWGFVPADHIVGRPVFVWLSLDKYKNFLGKIRFKRFFNIPR